MRMIDADALMKDICDSLNQMTDIGIAVDGDWLWAKLNDAIDNAPTVEPMRKRGRWIERECGKEDKEEGWDTVIVCSRCDFPATTFYSEDCESRTQVRTDFCPNCGCRMMMRR